MRHGRLLVKMERREEACDAFRIAAGLLQGAGRAREGERLLANCTSADSKRCTTLVQRLDARMEALREDAGLIGGSAGQEMTSKEKALLIGDFIRARLPKTPVQRPLRTPCSVR